MPKTISKKNAHLATNDSAFPISTLSWKNFSSYYAQIFIDWNYEKKFSLTPNFYFRRRTAIWQANAGLWRRCHFLTLGTCAISLSTFWDCLKMWVLFLELIRFTFFPLLIKCISRAQLRILRTGKHNHESLVHSMKALGDLGREAKVSFIS